MNKAYERINWKNYPSEETALNESNLNRMDAALNEVDTRVVAHETTKLDKATANTMVRNVSFNERTGIFTITYLNGSTKELDTKLEKIATNFRYDYATQKLILTLVDGTTQEIDMSTLITQYEFADSSYIKWTIMSDGKIKAEIINGSITADKLQPNFLADVTLQANSARTSEQNAKVSEENAKQSEINAKNYADSAEPVASAANGLNPTLDNSTAAPFITFEGKGATIQDGEPSPDNPVEILGVGESGSIAVKTCGKNLFDESKSVGGFVNANLIQISASTYKISELYPIGEYVVSWGSTTASYIYILYYNDSKDIIKRTVIEMSGKNSVQVKQESGASHFAVMYTHGGDNGTSFVYDLQIEKGATATPYEPYTETTANIPLSALLYDGDYIRYNMDNSGEESHKQQEMILNGSEDWKTVGSITIDGYFALSIGGYGYAKRSNIVCSHFVRTTITTSSSIGIDTINSSTYNESRIVVRPKIDGVTDLETWKAWLAENKPKVVYEMNEPVVTPLTAEQIAEFKKLQTFDGVTNVTCDGECEISYFADSEGGKAVAQIDKVLKQAIIGVESNKSLINDTNNLLNDAISKRNIREELTLTVGANLSATWEKDLSEVLPSGYALFGVVGYDITYKNLTLTQVRTGSNPNGGVSLYCTFSNGTNESKTVSTTAEFDLLLVKAELI